MSIQSEIYSTHRFLRRAKKFIEKVNESLNCEICYTHRKATTYTCTHKVCQTCYEKTKQCPFCRAPKPVVLFDYIYYLDGRWRLVTDEMRINGISENFEYEDFHRRGIFQVIYLLNELTMNLSSELSECYLNFLPHLSAKIMLVNTVLNYPIFVLKGDERTFTPDYRNIKLLFDDRIKYDLDREVLKNMIRKFNSMGIRCITLIESINDINHILQNSERLPS
jgi:hypothetical protein